jgi:hypothetical protein
MHRFSLGLLLLVVLQQAACSHLLVGCTGCGKTSFCNRNDGSVCGVEGSDGSSTTSVTYSGNFLIDCPGFGENRLQTSNASAGDPTLDVARHILDAVDQKEIGSVLWMVPCTERNVKIEDVKIMKLVRQMIGKNIPLVAIFNKGHPNGVCVKTVESFVNKCAEVMLFTNPRALVLPSLNRILFFSAWHPDR